MTPPIGFRTESPHDPSPLAAHTGRETASSARAAAHPTPTHQSPVYDYAYRIVAVSAALALMSTFL